MRVFVNNVDGFLAGAICADLWKLGPSFVGTRKGRADELVPPMVKKIVPRVEVRRLLKAVAACDVIIYDLHDADLEELELVLQTLHSSQLRQDVVFILLSSIGVWARTQREYEEVFKEPEPVELPRVDTPVETEPPPSAPVAAPKAKVKGKAPAPNPTPPPKTPTPVEPAPVVEAQADEAVADAEPVAPTLRPRPLRSEDYVRRVPALKFQEWKAIETQVLALKDKPGISPYVVCCGIPYGNGEDAFLGLFKAAWQTLPTLRVIGEGDNYLPLVHARDAARMVREVVEQRPCLEYHLAVDRGDLTQRDLVESVAAEFGMTEPIPSISVPEALLAELADILTLDLRMLPSSLVEAAAPLVASSSNDAGGTPDGSTAPEPSFRWWCEQGLATNIGKISSEFCRWRRLAPVRICIAGPPGTGADELAQRLAKQYCVPSVDFYQLVEEQRQTQTPLGAQLAQAMDEIEKGLANPKFAGPFHLPAPLAARCVEEGLRSKPAAFRGYVLSGYPRQADDLPEFFCDDVPPPPAAEKPLADEQQGVGAPQPSEEQPPSIVPRASAIQDAIVLMSSSEESCLARLKRSGCTTLESLSKRRIERWGKENPPEPAPGEGLACAIAGKLGTEPVLLNADEVEMEEMVMQVVGLVQAKRTLCNFLQPIEVPQPAPAEEEPVAGSPAEDEAAKQEADVLRLRRKEQEQKLEVLKRQEHKELEKHSEPLRHYLTSLVLPTLTSGMIDLCRERPDDPVGYLAEYLSVYSRVARAHGKRPFARAAS
jgi:adenylate kinase